jgi:molybdopterin-guanine dinucleotide biosynthesis protein A
MMKRGAIVLAGGQSRRMGRPKASLPFGRQTLLGRVLDVVGPLVSCQIVVAAADQPLPELPDGVICAVDQNPNRGPLEGLCAGLSAGAKLADVFYASSCDVPLLKREFVKRIFESMRPDDQIVVPRDHQHFHPLAAVYRHDVLPLIQALLEQNRLRPFFLFEQANTRTIDTEQLRDIDPQLDSLRNLNTPEDYQAALRDAGLDAH